MGCLKKVFVAILACQLPKVAFAGIISTGMASWYNQSGAYGSCGEIHLESDLVAAAPEKFMKGHCGGMACINYQGKRECAKVVDTLPKANPEGNIDLSIALFQSLIGDLDLGRVPVTWELFPPGSTDFAMDHNPEVKQSASDIQTSNSVESVSPTSSIPPAPSQDVASGNPSSSTEQPPAQGISSVSPGPQPAPILGMEADSEQSASKKKEEEAKEQERKKAEEENARKAAEEKRKKAEEATARKAAGEEKQKAEEETARKAATEEQERKKAEEETARKAVIEEQETKEAADGEHADPAKAEDSKVTETEQVEGEHFGTSVESTSAATSPSNPAGSAELPASTTLDLPAKEGTSTSQDNWLIAHQTFNGDTMTTSMHTPTSTSSYTISSTFIPETTSKGLPSFTTLVPSTTSAPIQEHSSSTTPSSETTGSMTILFSTLDRPMTVSMESAAATHRNQGAQGRSEVYQPMEILFFTLLGFLM